jgi:hypothetical protein
MGMRAGSYNAATPQWRGVIRDGSYPADVCVHTGHASQPDATACARAALATLRAGDVSGGALPAGWIHYQPGTPA